MSVASNSGLGVLVGQRRDLRPVFAERRHCELGSPTVERSCAVINGGNNSNEQQDTGEKPQKGHCDLKNRRTQGSISYAAFDLKKKIMARERIDRSKPTDSQDEATAAALTT